MPKTLLIGWDAADWKDKQPEDVTEQEQRRLRKLRKQAGTNQATFAWLRGRLLAAEGRHGEALVEFQQAEQVQMHNRPSLFQAQGEALPAMRRFADAEARFDTVLEIDPVNADGSLGDLGAPKALPPGRGRDRHRLRPAALRHQHADADAGRRRPADPD